MDGEKFRETLYEGKFLRLFRQNDWEFVQRKNCTGIAIILAMTEEGKILLIEQFRVPVGKQVIEFPGGLVNDGECGNTDETAETAETAAKRELLEETGYEARTLTPLATGPVNTGLSTDTMIFFRAQGLVKRSAGGGTGEFERIIVHEVPLAEVAGWLQRMESLGKAVDPKVYAGIYFLQNG